jgi:hypothetical protein
LPGSFAPVEPGDGGEGRDDPDDEDKSVDHGCVQYP